RHDRIRSGQGTEGVDHQPAEDPSRGEVAMELEARSQPVQRGAIDAGGVRLDQGRRLEPARVADGHRRVLAGLGWVLQWQGATQAGMALPRDRRRATPAQIPPVAAVVAAGQTTPGPEHTGEAARPAPKGSAPRAVNFARYEFVDSVGHAFQTARPDPPN